MKPDTAGLYGSKMGIVLGSRRQSQWSGEEHCTILALYDPFDSGGRTVKIPPRFSTSTTFLLEEFQLLGSEERLCGDRSLKTPWEQAYDRSYPTGAPGGLQLFSTDDQ